MGDHRVKINSQERHRVLQKLMGKNSVKCTTFELKKKEPSREEYAKTEEKIFSAVLDIDGVFAKDYIVARVLRAALPRRIHVPQELKIVGYDGTKVAELIYPKLTTVCQNYAVISRLIADALIHQIEQEERTKRDMVHDVILSEGGTILT